MGMRSADGVRIFDDAAAFDAGGSHVEGDGGSNDVGGFDDGWAHGALAEDDDAVRIANDGVGAEFHEFW